MSSHASAELLSAYLDRELAEQEAAVLELHLDQCHECHGRLQGLNTVVANLRHLERQAPPPTLDMAVARRIALAGERRGALDRLEDGLGAFQRRSNLMMWFAVVIALVLITFFFLHTLARSQNSNIPVTFGDQPTSSAPAEPETPAEPSTP